MIEDEMREIFSMIDMSRGKGRHKNILLETIKNIKIFLI